MCNENEKSFENPILGSQIFHLPIYMASWIWIQCIGIWCLFVTSCDPMVTLVMLSHWSQACPLGGGTSTLECPALWNPLNRICNEALRH